MLNRKRILIAVDRTVASRRVVNYVADMVSGRPGFHVGLVHLELPPTMLEWGGSEAPEIEEKKSAQRAEEYRKSEQTAIAEGRAFLRDFQSFFADQKIDVTALLVRFEEPLNRKNIARDILRIAKTKNYGTIVVGRHRLAGLKHLFSRYVGEQLVRSGEGVSIWVVE